MIRASTQGIALNHIQPRKPQQNAYIERYNRARHWARTNGAFNGSLRHEWPDLSIFETIKEAQEIATDWLWAYNNEAPTWASAELNPLETTEDGCLKSISVPR